MDTRSTLMDRPGQEATLAEAADQAMDQEDPLVEVMDPAHPEITAQEVRQEVRTGEAPMVAPVGEVVHLDPRREVEAG